MGYDCTLHVVDETRILNRFVPRLLGRSTERSSFDDDPRAAELWAEVRESIDRMASGDEPPETVANKISQLAIAECAAELPYHYERGFCLSLWSDQPDELQASLPRKFRGDSEVLFAEVVAAYPALRGKFPQEIESNWCPGVFVPAERLPELLKWVEGRVRRYPKPDRRLFRGLILVLKHAAERGLAYWEGTDLPVPGTSTIRPPGDQRRTGVDEFRGPHDFSMGYCGRGGNILAFGNGVGRPQRCRTAFADLSAWPPTLMFTEEYASEAAQSREGRWATASHTPDSTYRIRVSDRPDGAKTVLLPPDERRNGVHLAGFAGERVVAVLKPDKVYPDPTLLPGYPLIEENGRLVPIAELRPSSHEFPTFGVVSLNDGSDILVWDGEGYELREGRFSPAFALEAEWSPFDRSPMAPFGPDGFFFLSHRRLHSIRRGGSRVRHLPKLDNVMSVSPGPIGAVLLKEGKNKLGDLGKLYSPEDDIYIRIEPELLDDEDPDEIRSLLWASGCGRLVAATSERLWAIAEKTVLEGPRYRASTGRKLRV